MDFFNRQYRLIAEKGTQRRTWENELRVAFDVTHTRHEHANKGTIKVWGLSQDSRDFINDADRVIFEAGYVGNVGLVIKADAIKATSEKQLPEIITSLELGDGKKALDEGYVQATLPKGATPEQIFSAIKKELVNVEIGEGFQASLEKISKNVQGRVLDGSIKDEMNGLFSANGYDWSIQDGELQVVDREKGSNAREVIVISSDSGMIGSPKLLKGGNVEVNAFLIPSIRPGQRIKLESEDFNGLCVVVKDKMVGDLESRDWLVTMELKFV